MVAIIKLNVPSGQPDKVTEIWISSESHETEVTIHA